MSLKNANTCWYVQRGNAVLGPFATEKLIELINGKRFAKYDKVRLAGTDDWVIATVTIDAMGCQKDIAQEIRERKGHYVLGVKGNQPTLEADLVNYFGACLESNFEGVDHDLHESTETGHGRTDERIVYAVALPEEFSHREDWKDLKALVVVTSRRLLHDTETCESRYDITDRPPRAKSLGDPSAATGESRMVSIGFWT